MRSTNSRIRGGIFLILALTLVMASVTVVADSTAPHRSSTDQTLGDAPLYSGWLAGFESLVQWVLGADEGEKGGDIDINGQPADGGGGSLTTPGGLLDVSGDPPSPRAGVFVLSR